MPIVELFTLPTINILRNELNFSVLSQILFLIQVVLILLTLKFYFLFHVNCEYEVFSSQEFNTYSS